MTSLRIVSLLIIALMVAGLSPMSPASISRIHTAHAAAVRTHSLVGYYLTGWNNTPANPTITINEGDTLVITTSNGDSPGIQHHFFVDVDKDPVNPMTPNCTVDKCSAIIPPIHTDTLTGFTQGTYKYYCEYHAAMVGTFVVQPPAPDFNITANPGSLTLNQGTLKTSILNITSLHGFSGTVSLSPTAPTGITTALNSSAVTLATGASKFVALNITIGGSTSPGSYTVSMMASGGGNTHTANVAVTVVGPDFTVSLDQSSLSVTIGSSGNTTVTVTSQNGFSGIVNLAATVSPSGPTALLSSAMVTLTSGGSTTSKLTITTASGMSSSISPGSYTVTVTGTGDSSLSHSTSLPLTVTSPPSPAAPIPAYVLAIAGVAIVAAVAVTVIVVLRKRRPK